VCVSVCVCVYGVCMCVCDVMCVCVCVCVVLRCFGRLRIIEYSDFSKSFTFFCIVQIRALFETVLLCHVLYEAFCFLNIGKTLCNIYVFALIC